MWISRKAADVANARFKELIDELSALRVTMNATRDDLHILKNRPSELQSLRPYIEYTNRNVVEIREMVHRILYVPPPMSWLDRAYIWLHFAATAPLHWYLNRRDRKKREFAADVASHIPERGGNAPMPRNWIPPE